jgi:hypothetical protein
VKEAKPSSRWAAIAQPCVLQPGPGRYCRCIQLTGAIECPVEGRGRPRLSLYLLDCLAQAVGQLARLGRHIV